MTRPFESAFPWVVGNWDHCGPEMREGVTKRELFAAMFCAAAIANPDITCPEGTIVSDSITVADRLINALNEQDEDEEDAS